jgi:DNA processing protein
VPALHRSAVEILSVLGATGHSRPGLRRHVIEHLDRGGSWADVPAAIRAAGAGPAAPAWIESELESLLRLEVELIAWGDDDYPAVLAEIPDPPLALFLRGARGALTMTGIAIVGGRKCTPGGQNLAFRLARDVAAAGIPVVSGLALGIDGAAHCGALEARGVTVAVLGAGHLHLYPRTHRDLAEQILSKGALVTEYVPRASRRHHFPERNRLIRPGARSS